MLAMTKIMHALSLTMLLMLDVAPAKPDFYAILGIDFHESQHGIKQAFRKLSLLWHPDKHHTEEDKEKAQAKFIDISAAYATLGDEEKRRVYDLLGDDASNTGRTKWSRNPDTASPFYPRAFDSQASWNPKRAYKDSGQSDYAREAPRAKQAYTNPRPSYYARKAPRAEQTYTTPSQRYYTHDDSRANQAYTNPSRSYNIHEAPLANQAFSNPSQRQYAPETQYAKHASKSASKCGSGGGDTHSRRHGPYFQGNHPRGFHIGGQDGLAYASPFPKYESQRFGSHDSYAQVFPNEEVIFPKR